MNGSSTKAEFLQSACDVAVKQQGFGIVIETEMGI